MSIAIKHSEAMRDLQNNCSALDSARTIAIKQTQTMRYLQTSLNGLNSAVSISSM